MANFDEQHTQRVRAGSAEEPIAGTTMPAGGVGFIGWLSAIYQRLANSLSVIPVMSAGGHLSVQTAASGTGFAVFADQAARQITIINNTGTSIEVRQGAETVYLPVIDATGYTFYGLSNANQLAVRRIDQSATQVTVKARWES